MNRSPADESEPPRRAGARVGEQAHTESFVRRTVDRARERLRRFVVAVGRLIGTETRPRDELTSSPGLCEEESQTASDLVVAAEEVPRESRSFPTQTLPGRERVFTKPALDGTAADPPEPVAHVDGGTLTLELPNEPDTSITSDVWERVER